MLQMSMARVYSLKVSITSGARYHLVATYSVMNVDASLAEEESGGGRDDRARPKSQT